MHPKITTLSPVRLNFYPHYCKNNIHNVHLLNMRKKKSMRLEFYEADKLKLKALAKKRNIPLKNMLENHCNDLIKQTNDTKHTNI